MHGNFFSLYVCFRFLFSELSDISVSGFGSFIFRYVVETCLSILLLKESTSQDLVVFLLLAHHHLELTNTR